MNDRLALAGLVAGQSLRRLRRGLAAPLRMAAVWRARAPERIAIAPQDLRTTDPTIASDIYGGYFVFAGKAVNTHGESPFAIVSPSEGWTRNLMGFGWLRHLRAADSALARANARALVDDWIALAGRPPAGDPAGRQAHEAGWDAAVVARRILSWLSQSPIILDGADRDFYQRFMRSLGRQAVWLQRVLHGGLTGDARIFAAIALAELGLCAEGLNGLRKRASRTLSDEINRQILADGGHVSRNPRLLVDLLLDLLPLRQAYAARALEAPPALLNAIDRMMPMLRMFRHGDGALALFNGMGVTQPELLATLLAYDDASNRPVLNAPHSGYQRLEAGDALVIADAGAPPPRDHSSEGHAGCLSFEFSSGPDRIIVNCGAADRNRPVLREAARQTAAHSTLVLADTSSCRFAPGPAMSAWLDAQILAGPRRVTLTPAQDGAGFEATHDGYVSRFGLLHRRRLALTPDRLDGEDELVPATEGAAPPESALRFHLHPGVRTAALHDNRAIVLSTPSGENWAFQATAPLSLEESVLFASPDGARRTEQIVIPLATGEKGPVRWTIRRLPQDGS